jgi:hypothetical protein
MLKKLSLNTTSKIVYQQSQPTFYNRNSSVSHDKSPFHYHKTKNHFFKRTITTPVKENNRNWTKTTVIVLIHGTICINIFLIEKEKRIFPKQNLLFSRIQSLEYLRLECQGI